MSRLVAALAFWPVLGAAAEAPAVLPSTGTSGLLQMLLGLAVVLGVIAGTAWLARRYLPGGARSGGPVKVVGGTLVGPRERVVVVEVDDTWIVVGVTPTQVNALHTLPRPAHAESLPAAPFPPPGSTLARWLSAARRPGGSGGEPPA